MDKKIIIVGIAGAVFLIVQFYVIQDWTSNRQEELIDAFIKGYDKGTEDSIYSIYNETENCNGVPIFINNNSKTLIDYSCLETESAFPP